MSKTFAKVNIILWSTVALIAIVCIIGGIFGNKNEHNNNDGGIFNMSNERYTGDTMERKSETISEDVKDIKIEWARGRVDVYESENDEIKVIQKAPSDMPENKLMKVTISGRRLSIIDDSAKKNRGNFSINIDINNPPKTYLEVYLPKRHFDKVSIDGVSCTIETPNLDVGDLEIDTVSGDISVSGTFDKIDMNAVNGQIRGEGITAKKIELDTVSGGIDVEGAFSDVSVTLVSGSSKIVSSTMLKSFESEGVSGSSTLTIPENDGFSVDFSKVSGSFKSDFDTIKSGNTYTYGDGSGDFSVDTVSGSVTIKKN